MRIKEGKTKRTHLLDKLLTVLFIILILSSLSNSANASSIGDNNIRPLAVPFGYDDNYNTEVDTLLKVLAPGVLTNDTDADGDKLEAILDTTTSYGVLVLNQDGSFSYTPNKGYVGIDKYAYIVSDGANKGNVVTVVININPTNTAPVGVDDKYFSNQDIVLNIAAPGVLKNDTDADGDVLLAILDTTTAYGSLVLKDDGSFSYTPDKGYVGIDKFAYIVSDGKNKGNIVTVVLDVKEIVINTAPVGYDDRYSVSVGKILKVEGLGVLTNDTDIDGDALSAILETTTSYGRLILNTGGSFSYDADIVGVDEFTYIVFDGKNKGNTVTVVIDVIESVTTAAPTSFADVYSVQQDEVLRVRARGVLENDTDSDGDLLTAVLESSVSYGALTLDKNGSFVYTPNSGYIGQDKFSYKSYDGLDYSLAVAVVITIVEKVDTQTAPTVTSSPTSTTTKTTTNESTKTSSDDDPTTTSKTETSKPDDDISATPDLPVSANGPTIFMIITLASFAVLNIIRRRNH